MARYYRRRYTRTIVRAPKKKWATNIIQLSGTPQFDGNNSFHYQFQLCSNKTETTSPSPVIIKTGNFKVQFDLTVNVNAAGVVNARAFVCFVPQGVPTTTALDLQNITANHPEWILAWRQLDFGNANAAGSVDTSVVKFSSRLKRNLNSGDAVLFFILGGGDFTGITTRATIAGMAQFWTCAN